MKQTILTSLAAAGLLAATGAAADITGNVGLTTDYVFRGISQTDEKPAIQGGLDYAHSSGAYAGVWASNVDFNDGDVLQRCCHNIPPEFLLCAEIFLRARLPHRVAEDRLKAHYPGASDLRPEAQPAISSA